LREFENKSRLATKVEHDLLRKTVDDLKNDQRLLLTKVEHEPIHAVLQEAVDSCSSRINIGVGILLALQVGIMIWLAFKTH